MSQYIFVAGTRNYSWDQAAAAARRQNGELVSVNTVAEDAFIRGVLADNPVLFNSEPQDTALNGPWIGLRQPTGSAEPDGGWTWLDGTTPTFNGWHFGQPDNGFGDDYAFYWNNDGQIGWADQVADPVAIGYGAVRSYIAELADSVAVLEGGKGNDIIFGGVIANVIDGGRRSDVIHGGGGGDELTGGLGKDRFVFDSMFEADGARILDAAPGDRIDLRGIDANANVANDQRFRVVDELTGRAGQMTITFDGTASTLGGDTDGDGFADFTLVVNGDMAIFDGFLF